MQPDELKKSLKGMKGEELADLDETILAAGASGLSTGALNELSKHASSEKMTAVEEAIKKQHEPIQAKYDAHEELMEEYERQLAKIRKGEGITEIQGGRSRDEMIKEAIAEHNKNKPKLNLDPNEQNIAKLHKHITGDSGRPHV
jgi:hypothetical protein